MVLKLACEEEHMKMMVRKEVFELLKIPRELVHLKNQACKVSEREEEGEMFFAATLTGENHTACGSVIQVRIQHRASLNSSEAKRETDMLSGDSPGGFSFFIWHREALFPLGRLPWGLLESSSASTKPLLAPHLILCSRAWKSQCAL